jgi:DNA polymerase (family 10)
LVRERGLTSDATLEALSDTSLDGPDADVVKLLRQIHEAGDWVLLESTIADLPNDLRWLYESQAVSLEQMAEIHRALGITSAADIAAAVEEGRLAHIGVDDGTQRAIAKAVPALRAATRRIPLGRAVAIAESFLTRLESMPSVDWAVPSGSLRRGEETVGDIEIVASSTDPASAIDAVLADPDVVRSLHRSARRVYALVDRVQVGILFPAPDEAAAALVYRTGSTYHVAELRARAAAEALTLTSTGLFAADGGRVAIPTEEALYDRLGLPFIPPEIRSGAEEFAAAEERGIPRLVSRPDIRGDLHMHSMWSDGRDSIEAMVEQCRILGYEYVAITDHSPSSAASRNLSVDDVAKQAEEIARLRERFPTLAILHGCEVDILVDGRLDFPDRVLERFDIVLASLHERAGHSPDRLLHRYREATRHPLVAAITHPTNRMIPHRDGYDLDYDRLFAFAVETGTLLEVDGAPAHLDLDGALTRRAIAAGVTLVIDSDCHRSDALERQMYLGLLTARRGWAEPRHVLNTRPLTEVRAFIAAKRGTR